MKQALPEISAVTPARDVGSDPSEPIAPFQSIVGRPAKSPSKLSNEPGLDRAKISPTLKMGGIHRPGAGGMSLRIRSESQIRSDPESATARHPGAANCAELAS